MKFIFIAIFNFLLISNLFSQEGSKPKLECIEGNCINGSGKAKYSNGDTYIGEFKESLPDGQGAYT